MERVQTGQLSANSPPLYSDLDPKSASDPSKAPKFFAEFDHDQEEDDAKHDVLNVSGKHNVNRLKNLGFLKLSETAF